MAKAKPKDKAKETKKPKGLKQKLIALAQDGTITRLSDLRGKLLKLAKEA